MGWRFSGRVSSAAIDDSPKNGPDTRYGQRIVRLVTGMPSGKAPLRKTVNGLRANVPLDAPGPGREGPEPTHKRRLQLSQAVIQRLT
jgi:hypothetical protein